MYSASSYISENSPVRVDTGTDASCSDEGKDVEELYCT